MHRPGGEALHLFHRLIDGEARRHLARWEILERLKKLANDDRCGQHDVAVMD